jgi:uncharacterized protein (TIGR00369 family)
MSEPEAKLKRFIDAFLLGIPHIKALGIGYNGHGRGWAELTLPYAEHLVAYPDGGIIASGAILTLMDSVGGFSVMTAAEKMQPVATLDLRLDYLRAATPGKAVTGRAEVAKMTRSVVFVKGVAHDGEPDRPLALMTGTFMFTAGAKQ